MKISGLEKLSLVDYEGHLSCIAFVNGCNFKCPFCHNASLALGKNNNIIEQQEFFDFLKKRIGIITAVVVSGGEPTIYPDLKIFIKKIKDMNFKVKLDTNGTNPNILKELIDEKLIDYVAMDIKNSQTKYAQTSGINNLDLTKIKQSVQVLLTSDIDYEFRTTLVKGEHSDTDMEEIGLWLKGAKRLYLQHFKDSGDCIQANLGEIKEKNALEYKTILNKYIDNVNLRGY